MKIVIVGGGVTGLTFMNYLERSGIDVNLYEKNSVLTKEGSGILLGINVMKIMQDLGLEQKVMEYGQTLESINIMDQTGDILTRSDVKKTQTQAGLPTVCISRPDLHKILAQNLDTKKIHNSIGVLAVDKNADGFQLALSNGKQAKCDMIIGADGLFSTIRKTLSGDNDLRYSGYTCWRFVCKLPNKVSDVHAFEISGKGKRFGIFPMGGKGNGQVNEKMVYCYATLNAKQNYYQSNPLSKDDFSNLYKGFPESVQQCLNSLQNDEESKLIQRDISDLKTTRLCAHNLPAIYAGDAGHATTPNMGQGAAMGIEDAYVFNHILKKSNSSLEAAQKFSKTRYKRVESIRKRSLILGKIMQIENRVLRKCRNLMMKTVPSETTRKSLQKYLLDPTIYK